MQEDESITFCAVLDAVDEDLRRRDWIAGLGDETQRKIIALMMFAADHPDWAWTHFLTELNSMTIQQVAENRNISQSTVRRLLTVKVPVEIYDLLPPLPRAKGE